MRCRLGPCGLSRVNGNRGKMDHRLEAAGRFMWWHVVTVERTGAALMLREADLRATISRRHPVGASLHLGDVITVDNLPARSPKAVEIRMTIGALGSVPTRPETDRNGFCRSPTDAAAGCRAGRWSLHGNGMRNLFRAAGQGGG